MHQFMGTWVAGLSLALAAQGIGQPAPDWKVKVNAVCAAVDLPAQSKIGKPETTESGTLITTDFGLVSFDAKGVFRTIDVFQSKYLKDHPVGKASDALQLAIGYGERLGLGKQIRQKLGSAICRVELRAGYWDVTYQDRFRGYPCDDGDRLQVRLKGNGNLLKFSAMLGHTYVAPRVSISLDRAARIAQQVFRQNSRWFDDADLKAIEDLAILRKNASLRYKRGDGTFGGGKPEPGGTGSPLRLRYVVAARPCTVVIDAETGQVVGGSIRKGAFDTIGSWLCPCCGHGPDRRGVRTERTDQTRGAFRKTQRALSTAGMIRSIKVEDMNG